MTDTSLARKTLWILVISGVAYLLFTTCHTPAPKRDFVEVDLLIDVADMPNKWQEAEYSANDPYDKEAAENNAFRYFRYTDTPYLAKAGEDIYRYKNQSLAARNYQWFEREYLEPSNYDITSWQTPEGFEFHSAFANRWSFVCAYNTFSPAPEFGHKARICQYLAQYQEFIVLFGITIERDDKIFITVNDVRTILVKLDEKIGKYLEP